MVKIKYSIQNKPLQNNICRSCCTNCYRKCNNNCISCCSICNSKCNKSCKSCCQKCIYRCKGIYKSSCNICEINSKYNSNNTLYNLFKTKSKKTYNNYKYIKKMIC